MFKFYFSLTLGVIIKHVNSFYVKFVSFSHMATFTGTGQHTVSLHLVLICPYLTSRDVAKPSTLGGGMCHHVLTNIS